MFGRARRVQRHWRRVVSYAVLPSLGACAALYVHQRRPAAGFRPKVAYAFWGFGKKKSTSAFTPQKPQKGGDSKWRVIPLAEVRKHYKEGDIWVTFKGGVYNISPFTSGHPGLKSRLLMVGGQDVEPYWEVYNDHYRGHVIPWMQRFKIGELTPADAAEAKNFTFANAYEDDPKRHPDLLANTEHPFNGECRLERLTEEYYTPNELHYVRNHLPVPEVDADDWTLTVNGNGITGEFEFTLEDLKTKFKRHEMVATLQCAGNRREDFHDRDGNQVFIGPHWVVAAFGNAQWAGAKTRDVLKYCGVDVDAMALDEKPFPLDMQHVHFESADADETGLQYGTSVPIDKIVDPWGDCIFAYEMNGGPVPADHGYPVRHLTPGYAGNKSAKWVESMTICTETSRKPWHWVAYRYFAPDIRFEEDLHQWTNSPKINLDQGPIVYNMPVTSVICNPPQHTVLGGDLDEVLVKGFAWSGGGRGIARVDVSVDGGNTFTAADLLAAPCEQRRERMWGWRLFEKKIAIPDHMKARLKKGERVTLDLCSKAVNNDNNVQPEGTAAYYNARGVCINGWYHVEVDVDPAMRRGTVQHPKDFDAFENKPSGGRFMSPWGTPDKEDK